MTIYVHASVIEVDTGVVHRLGCPVAPTVPDDIVVVPAGSRNLGSKTAIACSICEPELREPGAGAAPA
jgi:hypothetical protein